MANQLEKLRAEEAELEAQMLGNPSVPTEPEEPVEDTYVSPEAPTEEGIERTEDEVAADEFMMDTITQSDESEEPYEPEPQPQKPKRTNWKKRFINYKSSTDLTLSGLRTELTEMRAAVHELMSENARLRQVKQEKQGDLWEGAFTQDDEDTFGTEGLDVVKKAAKVAIDRTVKPLQEELQRHEKQRAEELKKQAHEQKLNRYNSFLEKLGNIVPEYAELNRDKDFLEWMSDPDEYSGMRRMDLFRQAEASHDVGRVAQFFTDFQVETGQTQEPELSPEMQRHVTPVGSGGGGAARPNKQPDKGYYRQSDIDKFYTDVMKGRYAGQKDVIEATEKAIEQAALDGRILRNQ
jgi:hypothetical protein